MKRIFARKCLAGVDVSQFDRWGVMHYSFVLPNLSRIPNPMACYDSITPTFGYFDHDADIGIVGHGRSIEEAFINAAKAMFSLMTDLKTLATDHAVEIQFVEADAELALVTWLNLLLAEARSRSLVLSAFTLKKDGANWHGEAKGQAWNASLARGIEVKGATLTMLRVAWHGDECEARCVVDV